MLVAEVTPDHPTKSLRGGPALAVRRLHRYI
jgi:hypothetical protein